MNQMILLLTAISFFITQGTGFGAETTPLCSGSDVEKIQLPIYPDQEHSPFFEYKFQNIRTMNNPEMPTIIFLPGGPGGSSMVKQWNFLSHFFYAFPKEGFNFILTDPRGAGCNSNPEIQFSDDAFSTSYLAADILAMIRATGLKNYILYGHSYGSMLATEVVARAERGEAPVPKLVVLKGVVGRAWHATENDDQGYIDQWALLKSKLPKNIVERFGQDPLPFDFSNETWGNFIQNGLIMGENVLIPELNLSTQLLALEGDHDSQEKLRIAVQEADGHEPSVNMMRVHKPIACREIMPGHGLNSGITFEHGSFFPSIDHTCDDYEITNPFDSADWQIRAPIAYFQGENDPAVPMWQARYHLANQKSSTRLFFITVKNAGHDSLVALSDCKDEIWAALNNSENSKTLSGILEKCKNPTKFEFDETVLTF